MCYTELWCKKIFLLGDHIKARSFLVEHFFVFIQQDLAQKPEGYLEIYALDMASILLISVVLDQGTELNKFYSL